MSYAEGMRLGGDWYDSAKKNQRQETEDAWAAEGRARDREKWGREDKMRAEEDAIFNQKAPERGTFDPAASLGITRDAPPAPRPVEASAGSSYGSDSVGSLPPGGMAPQAIQPTNGAAPQSYAQQQRAMLQQQMDFAKAKRDPAAHQAAKQAMFQLQVGEDSSAIADYVQNAGDAEYKQLLSKVTADTRNKYEAVYDKKTGLTTLQLGDTKKDFTRAEMGEYFSAKNRLRNGDYAALADLKKLDSGLAAAVQADLKGLEGLANTNNRAAEVGRKIEHDGAMLGIEQKRLGLQRTAAGKPSYVQLVDREGNAQMVNANALPEKGGVLQLPEGMRYPKQRAEVDLQAVERRATALEGKPMPGLDAGGKKQVYDADSAYSAAMAQLYPQQGSATGSMSATDKAMAARLKSGGGGATTEPSPVGLTNAQLTAISRKPRGVSSQEAATAQQELDSRRSGAPTLKAW